MRKRKLILIPLLLSLAVPSFAQSTDQSFALDAGDLHASISVSNPPARRVVNSLREGLQSEIQYNIRVYERTKGLFSFLGDKLVGEVRRAYRARWDEFSGDYVITRVHASPTRFRSAPAFLAVFFRLSEIDTGIRLNPRGHYYVLSSVQIQIVRLVPPLTMIAPFLGEHQIDTPWTKTEIPARNED